MKKVFFLILPIFIFISYSYGSPSLLSSPGDFFRSAMTGDWSLTTTWESSSDNINWFAATLIPDSNANTISIRNGHTVTVSSNQDMDQVVIEAGGILYHDGSTLTINDGASGDDIIVQAGGIFTLASDGNGPVFISTGATANINTGGMLRLSATGLTFPGTGVNASNYIYQDASVLEYTLNALFASAGVTFFPNVDAVTIPIFRITKNIGGIGGVTPTAVNGLFEANGNITFQSSGTKTFRNGIIGTGHVNGSTSGKFIINGTTASLGGPGLLTLPTANGMDIGSSTTVTMVSDKSVTGNISLLSNALVILGSHNLTMTGSISGGTAASHIVTNGSGKLVMNNVGAFPAFTTFPIGGNTTTINPLALSDGGGLNFGARVEIGINPTIRYPVAAVNRTWFVTPSGTPGTVRTTYSYIAGDGNASFNYAANLELGFHTSLWNVIQTGLVPAGSYQVATTVSSFGANIEAPLVLGNLGAILAVDNTVRLTAQKQNDKAVLSWSVTDPAPVINFIPERSVDGRAFTALTVLSSNDLGFTDIQPLPGLNYYRIKMTDRDSKITYSNIAVILNAAKGSELISITANPVVGGNLKLNISAAQKMKMDIMIADMQGRLIQKQTVSMIAGFNNVPINVTALAAGTYQLYGYSTEGRSGVLRFVVR